MKDDFALDKALQKRETIYDNERRRAACADAEDARAARRGSVTPTGG